MSSHRLVAMASTSHRLAVARAQFLAVRSLSTSASSSTTSTRFPSFSTYRSVSYPILAVSVGLLAAQQLHSHLSTYASAASTSPAAATTTPATPASPAARSLPTFDLTTLPYYSAEAFRSSATVRLFQYQTCPFCNKVRAYLDWANVPYEVMEVNPMGKKELQFSGLKGVPVVTVDHITMNESSSIITAFDRLFQHYEHKQQQAAAPTPTATRASAASSSSSATTPSSASSPDSPDSVDYWRNWVDTKLIYLTAPNLYTSLSASLEAMDYIMTQSSLPASQRYLSKYIGGPIMYFVSEYRLKKKRNITDARQQLYDALRQWSADAVLRRGGGGGFSGGVKPDLSDVAVFGVCRAFMGFPAGEDIMRAQNVGEEFVQWYGRMEREVGGSKAKNRQGGGVKVGPDYVRQEVRA